MISVRAYISTSISKASWRSSFQSGERWVWWMQSQGQVWAWNVKVYLGGPFPYQGNSEEHNHTLADIGACAAARQVYLQGSSKWLIPVAYGQIQLWRVYHRHKFWTIQLLWQQLTSYIQCWHFSQCLASKGNRLVVLKWGSSKPNLWSINLDCYWVGDIKVSEGSVTNNSILNTLKGCLVGGIWAEFSIFLG